MSSSSILIRKFWPGDLIKVSGRFPNKAFTGMVLSGPFTQDNKEVYRIRPDFDKENWVNIRTSLISKISSKTE